MVVSGGGETMLTMQHELRKRWALELLQSEQVVSEMMLRVWLGEKQRESNSFKLDSKTVRRLTSQLDPSEARIIEVERPQRWQSTASDRHVHIILAAGVPEDSPLVQRVKGEIAAAKTMQTLARRATTQ
eukprot:5469323-Prymnesium_polylepis.1